MPPYLTFHFQNIRFFFFLQLSGLHRRFKASPHVSPQGQLHVSQRTLLSRGWATRAQEQGILGPSPSSYSWTRLCHRGFPRAELSLGCPGTALGFPAPLWGRDGPSLPGSAITPNGALSTAGTQPQGAADPLSTQRHRCQQTTDLYCQIAEFPIELHVLQQQCLPCN